MGSREKQCAPQRAPPWYRLDVDGMRRLCVPDLETTTLEGAIEAIEPSSPVTRRRTLCCGMRESKRQQPKAFEPNDWEHIKPERHCWKWDSSGPVCLYREDLWHSEAYQRARSRVVKGQSAEAFLLRKSWSLSGRSGSNRLLRSSSTDDSASAFQAPTVSTEWGCIAALMPICKVDDLEVLLQRVSLCVAGRTDSWSGGNLMYYAARAGDLIVCHHLIDNGFGALASETAKDGRTAYEVALANGFPDVAYILEPYAKIRNIAQELALHATLCQELQYVIAQDGRRVASKRRTSIFGRGASAVSCMARSTSFFIHKMMIGKRTSSDITLAADSGFPDCSHETEVKEPDAPLPNAASKRARRPGSTTRSTKSKKSKKRRTTRHRAQYNDENVSEILYLRPCVPPSTCC